MGGRVWGGWGGDHTRFVTQAASPGCLLWDLKQIKSPLRSPPCVLPPPPLLPHADTSEVLRAYGLLTVGREAFTTITLFSMIVRKGLNREPFEMLTGGGTLLEPLMVK